MEGERGNPRSSIATSNQRPSENIEEEEEYDSSDDDDMYLEPGEHFGAFLAPTDSPYDRKERVDTLNQHLQNTQTPERRQATRVRIREELNQYFFEGSDSDSGPGDDFRLARPSTRSNRPPSPRYPSIEKQRSSEGLKRSISGVQRLSSSGRSSDEKGATTTNNKR